MLRPSALPPSPLRQHLADLRAEAGSAATHMAQLLGAAPEAQALPTDALLPCPAFELAQWPRQARLGKLDLLEDFIGLLDDDTLMAVLQSPDFTPCSQAFLRDWLCALACGL